MDFEYYESSLLSHLTRLYRNDLDSAIDLLPEAPKSSLFYKYNIPKLISYGFEIYIKWSGFLF